MEEIFNGFLSPDEQVRNSSQAALEELMKDSNFIIQLDQFLHESTENQKNPNFLKYICIVIKEIIRINFGNYQESELAFLFAQLMDSIFLVPYEVRPILYSSVVSIFFPNPNFSQPSFSICSNHLSLNSIINISSSLYLISQLAFLRTMNKEQSLEMVELCHSILPTIISILLQAIQSLQSESITQIDINILSSCIESIAELFQAFISHSQSFLLNDNSAQLFQILLSSISIPNLTYKAKIVLFEMANSFIKTFFSHINYSKDEAFNPIRQFFIEQLIPIISQSIISLFQSKNIDPVCLSTCFSLISTMLKNKWCFDIFINPTFISQILIPSCYLSSDDISTFEEIPEQFLSFCYPFEFNEIGEITPRLSIFKMLTVICKNYPEAIDQILEYSISIIESSPSDLMLFESTLYIISCIIQYRPEYQKVFELLISLITSSETPYLIVSTALYALCNMKISGNEVTNLSLLILLQSPYAVIKNLAICLFLNTYQEPISEIPIADLLTVLLQLSESSLNSKPLQMLDLLLKEYSEAFIQFGSQIIVSITEILSNLTEVVSDNERCEFLNLLAQLIDKIPDDSELLMSDYLLHFCSESITQFPDSNYLNEYLNIIKIIIEKSNCKNSFPLIDLLCDLIMSNISEQYCWISDVVLILNILVQNEEFLSDVSYITKINEFIECVLEGCTNSEQILYVLFLISTLILTTKSIALPYIEKVLPMLFDESLDVSTLFTSLFCILSSCLTIDFESTMQLINEEQLSNFVFPKLALLNNSEMNHLYFILNGLTILSKNGSKLSYFASIIILHIINDRKQLELNPNQEEESDEYDGIEFPLPIDITNCIVAFREVSNVYMSELNIEEQEFIQNCLLD